MDDTAVASLNKKVARKFPEMKGVRPQIKNHPDDRHGNRQFLVTYSGFAALPGGRKIKRIVRIVANEKGEIQKLSTSK
jgi:hypothetical protein